MMAQLGIALLGVTAIWLSQSRNQQMRRYACLFGLAGQPFWFWSAISANQWGIFVLCCFYTVAWGRGVKSNWIDPAIAKQKEQKHIGCPYSGCNMPEGECNGECLK